MEITCKGCGSRFIVPDEKIPKGKIVKIKCPKCGEKTVIEPEQETKDELLEIEDYSYSDDTLSDVYEDSRLALFVGDDTDLLNRILQPIDDMGYRLIHAPSAKDAIGKMRLHHFDLIFLQEGFGEDIKESLVMKYINRLSMAVRRKTFVVLLSNNLKTLDQMMAYALSVNLILNIQDIDRIKDILNNAIKRHEAFYKPFFDIMKEIGKV